VTTQGGGQQALGTNWGDGFATDPALLAGLGLSDPRPFFDALAQKPYANQVGIPGRRCSQLPQFALEVCSVF